MTGCTIDGCEGDYHATGWCRLHYSRNRVYGSPLAVTDRRAPPLERFWRYVQKGKVEECWIWTGAIVRGYGKLGVGGRNGGMVQAHRFSYQEFNGPIPDGMVVMHKCDVTACVNPDHLTLGTQTDNMDDMRAKGRGKAVGPKGERQHLARLTADIVREIRVSNEGETTLARRFGVHRDSIGNVRRRKTWRHIT